LESKLGIGSNGRQARPARGGACRAGAQVAGLSGFAAAVGATGNSTQVIESRCEAPVATRLCRIVQLQVILCEERCQDAKALACTSLRVCLHTPYVPKAAI
jgi:hypothetical protein